MEWLSPIIRGVFEPIFSLIGGLSFFRVVLGFILVFFAPGFAWTLVLFRGKQINHIERVALSFGLSIATVTLSILALNILIGMRITGFNSVLVIMIITIIPIIFYGINRYRERH